MKNKKVTKENPAGESAGRKPRLRPGESASKKRNQTGAGRKREMQRKARPGTGGAVGVLGVDQRVLLLQQEGGHAVIAQQRRVVQQGATVEIALRQRSVAMETGR